MGEGIEHLAQSLRQQAQIVNALGNSYVDARCSCGTLDVRLMFEDEKWRLELNDTQAIPVHMACAWAQACGAPKETRITSAQEGKRKFAIWEEWGNGSDNN